MGGHAPKVPDRDDKAAHETIVERAVTALLHGVSLLLEDRSLISILLN